jgi:hypothetical protein
LILPSCLGVEEALDSLRAFLVIVSGLGVDSWRLRSEECCSVNEVDEYETLTEASNELVSFHSS